MAEPSGKFTYVKDKARGYLPAVFALGLAHGEGGVIPPVNAETPPLVDQAEMQRAHSEKMRIFLEGKPGEAVEFLHPGVQFTSEVDATDLHYQQRACSPAAMFMLMSYVHRENPNLHGDHQFPTSLDALIKDALSSNVRSELGWTQTGWLKLAEQYGVTLNREDYGEQPYAVGEQQLLRDLEFGPAIVSLTQMPESHNFHAVLVDGFYKKPDGDKGYYVYDPIAKGVNQVRDASNPQARFHREGFYPTSKYAPDFSLEKYWTGRWLAVTDQSMTTQPN